MPSGRAFSFVWKISLAVLLAAIAGAALFWLGQSSLVSIDEIIIEGNHVLTTEQIMQAAGPLLRGQSIIRPPFDAVRAELSSQPFVEGIDFERDFPHTVIIHVREYRPQVMLRAAGGKNFIIASDGKVLMEQSATSPAVPALPALATAKPCASEVGKTADCDDVLTGTQFLANIPVSFNYQFAELSVAGGDIRAKTASGVNVHFGSLDEYGLKFEVLRQLLARASVAGVPMTIDVSVPERPVTKDDKPPAGTTTAAAASENGTPADAQQVAGAGDGAAAGATGAAQTGAPGTAAAGAAGAGASQPDAATGTGQPQAAQ